MEVFGKYCGHCCAEMFGRCCEYIRVAGDVCSDYILRFDSKMKFLDLKFAVY